MALSAMRPRKSIMAINVGKVALHESGATGKWQHRGTGAGTIVVVRPVDSISPQLRAALHGNQLLPAVQAQLVPAVQHELLPAVQSRLLPAVQSPAAAGDTVLLRNVRIVSIAPAWANGSPQEQVTFEYGALTVTNLTSGHSISQRPRSGK
jgi:type VI protein secretion system component Hcp